MKVLLVIGICLLLNSVYSTIEFHKFTKDSLHAIPLPKDVSIK